MGTDERELVTFRIVHAKVMETRIVSEEDVIGGLTWGNMTSRRCATHRPAERR
jgi:hypothetical protein